MLLVLLLTVVSLAAAQCSSSVATISSPIPAGEFAALSGASVGNGIVLAAYFTYDGTSVPGGAEAIGVRWLTGAQSDSFADPSFVQGLIPPTTWQLTAELYDTSTTPATPALLKTGTFLFDPVIPGYLDVLFASGEPLTAGVTYMVSIFQPPNPLTDDLFFPFFATSPAGTSACGITLLPGTGLPTFAFSPVAGAYPVNMFTGFYYGVQPIVQPLVVGGTE